MKLNTEWLRRDFGVNLSDEDLINTLTNLGFEVESVTKFENFSILDVNITPNRGDCMSHLGIARELLALSGKKLQQRRIKLKESQEKVSKYISVSVLDKDLCPRYCARIIKDVKIHDSPDWLKKRLESVGIRSINNVVDATNYILMEIGHPLHAFDLDKIKGNKIIVRRAKKGEKLKTLDGIERELSPENLVIADEEKAIALAGIMGGENTEVSLSTTSILLEAAVFLPESIQGTSKKLKIETESSIRFSRGVDFEGVQYALDRAAEMIQKLAGGRILKSCIDISRRHLKGTITFSVDTVKSFLGIDIKEKEIIKILNALNFKITKKNKNIIVSVPSYRNDISFPADIYEEIARHYGYDRIPLIIPSEKLYRSPELKKDIFKIIREKMQSMGFTEVITYSFINPDYRDKLLLKDHNYTITMLNPLSQDRSVMRPMLIPGLLEVAEYNINHGNSDLRLFETGRVFHYNSEGICIEEEHLAGLMTGSAEDEWYAPKRPADFYDIKGIIEEILGIWNLHLVTTQSREPYLVPNASVDIFVNGEKLGIAGEITPEIKERTGIKGPCIIFELNIDNLIHKRIPSPEFKQIPRLLAIERDISVIVDKKIPAMALIDALLGSSKLISTAKIFDVYEGKNIPSGRKSIGIRIQIQPLEKNLTEDEIDNIILNVVKILEKNFNAELRGTVYDKGRPC